MLSHEQLDNLINILEHTNAELFSRLSPRNTPDNTFHETPPDFHETSELASNIANNVQLLTGLYSQKNTLKPKTNETGDVNLLLESSTSSAGVPETRVKRKYVKKSKLENTEEQPREKRAYNKK